MFSVVNGRVQVTPIEVIYTGSDTLKNGMALCYDHDASTAAAREANVEKPSLAALLAGQFAGIVTGAPPTGTTGNGSSTRISILPWIPGCPGYRNLDVQTDQNVAAGDILGPVPESYYFGFGVIPGCALFRAAEAQNRSVTAGIVNGAMQQFRYDEIAGKIFRQFHHFDGSLPITLGGATPAETKYPGLLVSGATVAIAGTADVGGRMALTPTTTTIAQLNSGGIAAFTASGADLLPYTLSAGKSIFVRGKVNFGVGAVDNSAFFGLSITGAATSNAAVPATDDYLGFFKKVDDDGSLFFATNRDNGTDNLTDTGINTVADTMYEVAFYAVNRVSGDAAEATKVYAYVNNALVATLSSAAINALINKDEGMALVLSGIDGAAAVVLEIDYWEGLINT